MGLFLLSQIGGAADRAQWLRRQMAHLSAIPIGFPEEIRSAARVLSNCLSPDRPMANHRMKEYGWMMTARRRVATGNGRGPGRRLRRGEGRLRSEAHSRILLILSPMAISGDGRSHPGTYSCIKRTQFDPRLPRFRSWRLVERGGVFEERTSGKAGRTPPQIMKAGSKRPRCQLTGDGVDVGLELNPIRTEIG
jgi:hypothetical protein